MRAAAYNRAVEERKNRRLLALDVGSKRIGLAATDETGRLVIGLRTLERKGKRADMELLRKIARRHAVEALIVGKPVNMDGTDSLQTQRTVRFAVTLSEALALPVHFVDERLTSWQAEQSLEEAGVARKNRKGLVDELAAKMILAAYLSSRSNQR